MSSAAGNWREGGERAGTGTRLGAGAVRGQGPA